MSTAPKPLNRKQERFIDEYLIDLNGTQAAIRAGYTVVSAEVTGHRLLRNHKISTIIAMRRSDVGARLEVTVERIIAEYAKLGFANMADYITGEGSERTIDLTKLTRDQAASIQEITVETYMDGKGESAERVKRTKLKLADKRGALDSLAKHLGMFVERLSVDVTVEHKSELVDKILAAIQGRAPVVIEGVAKTLADKPR